MADILEIGAYRMQHPRFYMTRPMVEEDNNCLHQHFTAHPHGQIITCDDCHCQISAWWALMRFSEQYRIHLEVLQRREQQLAADEAKAITLRAAQRVEHAWRQHHLAPACPHCLHIILPTDGFGNLMFDKDDAENARRSYLQTAKVIGMPTGEGRN